MNPLQLTPPLHRALMKEASVVTQAMDQPRWHNCTIAEGFVCLRFTSFAFLPSPYSSVKQEAANTSPDLDIWLCKCHFQYLGLYIFRSPKWPNSRNIKRNSCMRWQGLSFYPKLRASKSSNTQCPYLSIFPQVEIVDMWFRNTRTKAICYVHYRC